MRRGPAKRRALLYIGHRPEKDGGQWSSLQITVRRTSAKREGFFASPRVTTRHGQAAKHLDLLGKPTTTQIQGKVLVG